MKTVPIQRGDTVLVVLSPVLAVLVLCRPVRSRMMAPTLLCPTFPHLNLNLTTILASRKDALLPPVDLDDHIWPEIPTKDGRRVDNDGDPGGIH
jgi:hypothetical protein